MTAFSASSCFLNVKEMFKMIAWVFLILMQIHSPGIISSPTAHALSGENQISSGVEPSPNRAAADKTGSVIPIMRALEVYNNAFQARNLDALGQIFADDIVMFEQGTQNIGKSDVLNNHLGPELRSFQELSPKYSDVRIQESNGMAIITRQFSIKGKSQGRPFVYRGSETQGWNFREGRWQLTHIHMSFLPSR